MHDTSTSSLICHARLQCSNAGPTTTVQSRGCLLLWHVQSCWQAANNRFDTPLVGSELGQRQLPAWSGTLNLIKLQEQVHTHYNVESKR